MPGAEDVHRFWFDEHGPDDWFAGKPEFDALIAERFGDSHASLAMGEGWTWRQTAHGRLAEIIVLDQFSRQLYRGDARAFAQDGMALILAQELVARGDDRVLRENERAFAYLPYMHAESALVQAESLRLHEALGNDDVLGFARKHAEVIARFGRFPKRNAALGRVSTPKERTYLAEIGDRAF